MAAKCVNSVHMDFLNNLSSADFAKQLQPSDYHPYRSLNRLSHHHLPPQQDLCFIKWAKSTLGGRAAPKRKPRYKGFQSRGCLSQRPADQRRRSRKYVSQLSNWVSQPEQPFGTDCCQSRSCTDRCPYPVSVCCEGQLGAMLTAHGKHAERKKCYSLRCSRHARKPCLSKEKHAIPPTPLEMKKSTRTMKKNFPPSTSARQHGGIPPCSYIRKVGGSLS